MLEKRMNAMVRMALRRGYGVASDHLVELYGQRSPASVHLVELYGLQTGSPESGRPGLSRMAAGRTGTDFSF